MTAIPLQESRALTVVNAIAIRFNHSNAFPPHIPREATELQDAYPSCSDHERSSTSQSTKVKFSDTNNVKILSPRSELEFRPSSPSSTNSSGASTPVSDSDEVTPVAKALATRLSFWSRLSKRQSMRSIAPDEEELIRESIQDKLDNTDEEPSEVLQEILEATSPMPPTAEERQNELDDKILKECIREFTKGGMYFAYNFGMYVFFCPS